MTNWNTVTNDVPELAELVQRRFDTHGLGYLATLREDGAPRVSGIEQIFSDGEVWMGMMWHSRKALDLQRDGRCALHSANTDRNVAEGDARISGQAIEVTSDSALDRAREAFTEHTGNAPPEGPMHLFRIDITELVFVRPEHDRLVIRSWRPGFGERRAERT